MSMNSRGSVEIVRSVIVILRSFSFLDRGHFLDLDHILDRDHATSTYMLIL